MGTQFIYPIESVEERRVSNDKQAGRNRQSCFVGRGVLPRCERCLAGWTYRLSAGRFPATSADVTRVISSCVFCLFGKVDAGEMSSVWDTVSTKSRALSPPPRRLRPKSVGLTTQGLCCAEGARTKGTLEDAAFHS